jgi:hypothetical protein
MPAVPVAVNYGNVLTEIQMVQFDADKICGIIKNMPKDGLMVEWGSGGSTCKWIETLTDDQKLITIEHNENWYNRVTRAVSAEFGDISNKFTFHHIPEKYIEHGYGSLQEEHPCGTADYLNPNANMWNADIFFIDGIARGACLLTTLFMRKKRESIIMVHDFPGREAWYDWATQHCTIETFTDQDQYSSLAILTQK